MNGGLRWFLSILPLLGGCVAAGPPTGSLAEEVKVCPAGPVVEGIDVSIYQGTIDWTKVKAAGIQFAYIRVSDGTGSHDSKFASNWANARAAGVLRGVYQFFREDEDPIAQADLLLDAMGALEPDDLPPAIDVESVDGASGATIVANVKAWMDRIEAGSGRRAIIYTGRPFWDSNTGSSTAVSDHPLWIPNWGVTCPSISVAWSGWGFWQYSSTGMVSGISGAVDLDRFNGDRDALLAFAAASADSPPSPDAGTAPKPDAPPPQTSPDAPAPQISPDAPTQRVYEAGTLNGACQVGGDRTGEAAWAAGLIALLVAARFPRRRARAKIARCDFAHQPTSSSGAPSSR
jgi:lysozyme